ILWEMLTGERREATPAEELQASDATSSARVRPSGMHRDLDARHDAVVFSLLDREPARRPADAFAARRALGALPWPSSIERVAIPRAERKKVSERPSGVRLLPDGDGAEIDQWLGRRVVSVPLEPAMLGRASLFARADHPALQAVLRVDRPGHAIWLA